MTTAHHDDALVDRFTTISVWKKGGKRAPHKPLLLLLALARLQRGEPRLAPWREIEHTLGELLDDFGPPRKSSPQYPFWRLQNDSGLWEIPERDGLIAERDRRGLKRTGDIPVSVLRDYGAHGGFPTDLDRLLRARPDLVHRITAHVLDEHFAPSTHNDLLDAVGFPGTPAVPRARRDPAFRDTIMRIYEQRCALCGYDGRLHRQLLGIEAAHVRWFSHGGPDTPDNGLALCSFHHTAFDKGALALDDDRHVLVSGHVVGRTNLDELLFRFIGRPLRAPQPGFPSPALEFLQWHRREVFRGPERGTSSP